MQYSIKIQIDNEEYPYNTWLNEILMPNYSIIVSCLELNCLINGMTLNFDEQTMRVSLR